MTQHMLSMPVASAVGLNGTHGSTPDYAGLNGRRAASVGGATICAD